MPAQPEPTDTLLITPHSTLHKAQHNVKAYGATGNGSSDDTASIQSAVTAMGTTGTLLFPPGTYKISDTIQLGAVAGGFQHVVKGGGGFADIGDAKIMQTDLSKDIFNVTYAADQATNFLMEGMYLNYPSQATGTALKVTNTGYCAGFTVRDCRFHFAGVAIQPTSVVCPRIYNSAIRACAIGVKLDGASINQPTFENVWFQVGTVGIDLTTLVGRFRAASCVFEAYDTAAVRLNTGGALWNAHFDSCWFESFPNDIINISGTNSGRSGQGWRFTGCNLWAQSSSSNVINNTLGLASAGQVLGITFDGCEFELNGGKILNVAQFPASGAGDAGYTDVSFLNCRGQGGIKGVHPYGGYTNGGITFNGPSLGPGPSNIIYDSFNSGIPYVVFPRSDAASALVVNSVLDVTYNMTQGIGGYHEFKEDGTNDPAAGAANTGRLYVRDNGAGKTQLCVRFNTGVVQVIATQP